MVCIEKRPYTLYGRLATLHFRYLTCLLDRGHINRRLYFVSLLRMVVVPLIALLLIKLSHLAGISQDAPKIMLIVFLAVITPSASTVTQMCQVYGNDSKYASAINVITTLSAIVTMPVMVFLFENVIL